MADLGGGGGGGVQAIATPKSSEPYIHNALLILCLACKHIDLPSNEHGGSSGQF